MTSQSGSRGLTKTEGLPAFDVEQVVRSRYAAGARQREQSLCCPTSYDRQYLDVLPAEILERDYGCGDPTPHVHEGQTVLDLGSGGGKICYILSQKVGAKGNVIGVDFNDEMLGLARRYRQEIAARIGFDNVRFFKGRIQDLALDLDRVDTWLSQHPIADVSRWYELESFCERLRQLEPMVANDSVDVVVSNCVLNLVRAQDKHRLFAEIFRVLRNGGRAVICDIVSDEDVTDTIRDTPDLWSGCIAGAIREDRFLQMFEEAGFFGIQLLARQDEAWQTIEGVEFRSVTVQACKGKQGPCLERNQAVVYAGPWRQVCDDDGHAFYRGQRAAVCDKTFQILTNPYGPYAASIHGLEPYESVPLDAALPFDCKRRALRHPRETKGESFDLTMDLPEDCGGPDCC